MLNAVDPLLEVDWPGTAMEAGLLHDGMLDRASEDDGDVTRRVGRDGFTGVSIVTIVTEVVGRKPPGGTVVLGLFEALADEESLTATDFKEVAVRMSLSALLWLVVEALTDAVLDTAASPPTTAVNMLFMTDLAELFRKPNLPEKPFGLSVFQRDQH